jgi:hypothetical protein
MFDALLLTGLVVTAVGIVLLGLAMFGDPVFGPVSRLLTVLLGIVGLGAATVVLIDPTSLVAALGVFALIGFHLVLGWRVFRLSTVG